MGQRRQPRKTVNVPVRIFGTDIEGRPFSENVSTVDVSRAGARLSGIQARIKPGEVIGLTYKTYKTRVTVKWVGEENTAKGGHVGVVNLKPETPLWDFPLAADGADEFRHQSPAVERRKHPRFKCVNSVEIHAEGTAAPIWAKAVDLSLGGCFAEMPIPLPRNTNLKIGLWVKEQKLKIKAKVVNSRPGFGIGIQFIELSTEDSDRLKQFLSSITRIRM